MVLKIGSNTIIMYVGDLLLFELCIKHNAPGYDVGVMLHVVNFIHWTAWRALLEEKTGVGGGWSGQFCEFELVTPMLCETIASIYTTYFQRRPDNHHGNVIMKASLVHIEHAV
jgi:hypothetical protein